MAASGILTIADLTDKRVGIGPQGGTTGIYMPEFFKVLKVNPMSRTGSWTRTAGVMATVDAQPLNSSMLATAALRASAHWLESFRVRARDQRRRHSEAQRSGRLQVDDELELGGLDDRQVSGVRAFENLTGVDADLTKHVRNVGAVAHQQAGFDHLTVGTTRWYPIARRQRDKLAAATGEDVFWGEEEGIGP